MRVLFRRRTTFGIVTDVKDGRCQNRRQNPLAETDQRASNASHAEKDV